MPLPLKVEKVCHLRASRRRVEESLSFHMRSFDFDSTPLRMTAGDLLPCIELLITIQVGEGMPSPYNGLMETAR